MKRFQLQSTVFKNIAFSLLGLALLNAAPAQANVNLNDYISYLPTGASVGFAAENLNRQQTIADYNQQILMLPASTQKVFTALAAKLTLGDQFQFATDLVSSAKISNKILQGDLSIRFSGDPTLRSGQLYQLLAQLKQQGIDTINGNIVLDTSIFNSHDRGLGWIWNDLTMCFNAPPSAASIDGNCFSVELNASGAIGELVQASVPSHFPVQVFSQVRIVSAQEAANCAFDVVVNDNNRYTLKGCIARQSNPFGLSFAVQDTDAYAIAIVMNQLQKLKINVNGQIRLALQPTNGTILASHYSKPLPDLLKQMMKKSDNQIADSLFRRIGYQYYQKPVSFQQSALAMRQILSKQAEIDFGNSQIADGSGLSRQNLISPAALLQALDYISRHEDTLDLLDTFPIAGQDGTLSGRGSMGEAPLAKNLIAKTGALKGVYNLAGFMQNAKGERIAFVQFINGYSTGDLESRTKRSPLVNFEKGVFNALYQNP
ncbi:serine-type D-Ala-D-Ala carboxypeptidase [Testudinibacter sp. TR-2022]|uniref:serine-type D-Ala-D-Ala carboxypeptidase n=1 Tax=Testudinibacter sp. TR-2022 TaxID=2585029 RepID=UPI00111B2CF7|nr:serine-type D-Ala-D-Ala carboxypeptidase [Testudinibacter sp. TR-2022]TNH06276.1 serine-type D-Ala-D-Ala carboxypeptidase [Pasteurellaceae bacterium Phil11]TNH23047.1 serine-type D-Ala-D-Ala carboxypeptidase [Testudinibacter sp. TR-2022]TNH26745.1 serine-type D-Ala-D-Ala carboxypeptidase [Testudinibacter sp. TR-2022]